MKSIPIPKQKRELTPLETRLLTLIQKAEPALWVLAAMGSNDATEIHRELVKAIEEGGAE